MQHTALLLVTHMLHLPHQLGQHQNDRGAFHTCLPTPAMVLVSDPVASFSCTSMNTGAGHTPLITSNVGSPSSLTSGPSPSTDQSDEGVCIGVHGLARIIPCKCGMPHTALLPLKPVSHIPHQLNSQQNIRRTAGTTCQKFCIGFWPLKRLRPWFLCLSDHRGKVTHRAGARFRKFGRH
jgi:hypothetical protein